MFRSNSQTLLCLSSGARPRYLEDVIRSLALPPGGRIQFRYIKDIVSDDVWQNLSSNNYVGHTVLIAYLDSSNQDISTQVVPCRFATVVRTECPAGFAVIEMQVGAFAKLIDKTEWRHHLKSLNLNYPTWKEQEGQPGKKELLGEFCLSVETLPPMIEQATNLSDWQDIVDELAPRKDFERESCFLAISNPTLASEEKYIEPIGGYHSLKGGRKYQLPIVFYHPSHKDPDTNPSKYGWIFTDSDGPLEIIYNGNTEVDSPYDKYDVGFRTNKSPTTGSGTLAVFRKTGDTESTTKIRIAELRITVARSWGGDFLLTLTIGLLLAFQTIFSSYSEQFAYLPPWLLFLIALFLGTLIAGFAVFGIRRPI